MKTAIIIPARMASKRFPNKPMVKICGVPMIERVWRQGINANIGDVIVACSEKEVFDLISSKGGRAIMTDANLPSGTDRVHAAFNLIDNKSDYESIINLQGDMPMIDPNDIKSVNLPLEYGYDIGTLATNITSKQIKKNVLENTSSGSIIVFHNNQQSLKNLSPILKEIIQKLKSKRFSFSSTW